MSEAPKIKLGSKEYVVLPMNLKTIIAISPLLKSLEKISKNTTAELPEQEDFENIVKIIYLALKRGNSDLTSDEIAEELDMKNMLDVLQVIMQESGAVAAGEVVAGSR